MSGKVTTACIQANDKSAYYKENTLWYYRWIPGATITAYLAGRQETLPPEKHHNHADHHQ